MTKDGGGYLSIPASTHANVCRRRSRSRGAVEVQRSAAYSWRSDTWNNDKCHMFDIDNHWRLCLSP